MKYTAKAKLKYVLVKDKDKSTGSKTIYKIYDAKDTYSGVHYAEGGLTDAEYVSKRNSIVVDTSGKVIEDKKSGVWLKETAKPLGSIEKTEAMDLNSASDWQNYLKGGSGGAEVELSPNRIFKSFYGWKGKTQTKSQINGYDWEIVTMKRSNGKLVSDIQGGKIIKGDGYSSFKYTPTDDPSATLIVTTPKVVNEKRVREQHEQAVAEFKKMVAEGRLPKKKYAKGGEMANVHVIKDDYTFRQDEPNRVYHDVEGMYGNYWFMAKTDNSHKHGYGSNGINKGCVYKLNVWRGGNPVGRDKSTKGGHVSEDYIAGYYNKWELRPRTKEAKEVVSAIVEWLENNICDLKRNWSSVKFAKGGETSGRYFLSEEDEDGYCYIMDSQTMKKAPNSTFDRDDMSGWGKIKNKFLKTRQKYGRELTTRDANYIIMILNRGGDNFAKGGDTDSSWKKRQKMFGFKPYGSTKGRYMLQYIDEGQPQQEIHLSKEMAIDVANRYKRFYSNVRVIEPDGTEIPFYAKGGEMANYNGAGIFGGGGGIEIIPPKGELRNADNHLLKYEKNGNEYEFYVYKPVSKLVSGYEQTKHICVNADCALKMNYKQFINYLYGEGYIDDRKNAKGGYMADGGRLENISPVIKPKIEAIEKILPKALGEGGIMTIVFAFQTKDGYAFNMESKSDYPVNRATPKLKRIGVVVERTGEKGKRLITIPKGVFDQMTTIYMVGGEFADGGIQNHPLNIQIHTKIAEELGMGLAEKFISRDYRRKRGIGAVRLLEMAVERGFISLDEVNSEIIYSAEEKADDSAYMEEIGSSDTNIMIHSMLRNAGIEMDYEGGRIVRKYSTPEEANIKSSTHKNEK